jgi:membrane-bound lytic murein transglycosylase D
MRNILNLMLIAGFVTGCANGPIGKNTEVTPKVTKNDNGRVQQHLVDHSLPFCDGCLIGSVGDAALKNSNKKIYFLYGAEHLNLTNNYFDIPVVYNKATQKWIKYFTGRGRKHFARYAQRSGRYAPVLSKILNDQGLPRDLIYLAMAESGFQNHARSWAKAVGPWQFMPYTGKKFGLHIDFFQDERRDPLKATVAASMYLRDLYERFGAWELAMAGYNAGEGKIGRAIRRYRTKNFWKIRKGRYLKSETKNYVPKIMALAIIGKNLKAFGFENIEFDKALDFQEITVPGNTDLYNVAAALGMTFEEVKKFNPELIRWQTPPTESEYILRVPVGKKVVWNNYPHKESVVAKDYKVYQLRGYASLYHVGRKFKVPAKVLSEINKLPPKKRLFPKTAVYLPFRTDHGNHRRHRLYSDLYERPRKSVLRRRAYQKRIRYGMRKGKKITNPKEFYIVKKGDTLWDIARKTGVSINTIIRSNGRLVKRRMILPGDKLAIR